MRVRHVLPTALAFAAFGCGAAPVISINTPAFSYGSDIPVTYTCRGENQAPPMAWSNLPPKTQSLAFVVEDMTAKTTNWLVYDIVPDATGVPEQGVPNGGIQGKGDQGKDYYVGPCGPRGALHRYSFRVIALDKKLGLAPGATRAQFDQAMKGHKLAEGEIQAKDNGV